MFFVIISISIYIFGIYLILVLSTCNAIQSTDCHVRYFNKLSIYLSIRCFACFSGRNIRADPRVAVNRANSQLFQENAYADVVLTCFADAFPGIVLFADP